MTERSRLSGARLVPAAAIVVLTALSFLPRATAAPAVAWSFRGAALGLLVWYLLVLRSRLEMKYAVEIRKPHWVQLFMHSSVYAYWGWYWEPVYAEIPLLLGQVAFGYAFTALLAWQRRQTWSFGFGVFPIVFSTNLFMWFKDDWYALQFVMLIVGFLGKELIRWERHGRKTHIFNPSGFSLSVVSLVLLATGTTHITWGPEVAYTIGRPEYIYQEIFLLGLVVQWLFHVTLMTFGAALMLWLLGIAYHLATGVYFFIDTSIPIAVFLGLHLLFTDPATSPRTSLGRFVFGGIYAIGVYVLYWLLGALGVPTHYDKLLCVPLLNLSVRAIERWTPAWKLPIALSPKGANALHMAAWSVVFFAMWGTDAIGAKHPGTSPRFWETACGEDRRNACQTWLRVLSVQCADGSTAMCNELAVALEEGRAAPPNPVEAARHYQTACAAGHPEACANLASMRYEGRGVERDRADALALSATACELGLADACTNVSAQLLHGDGAPADPARAASFVAKACDRSGAPQLCEQAAAIHLAGRFADRPVPRDPARAAAALERACDAGAATACANLGLMHERGDGIPADAAAAQRLRSKACQLGLAQACATAAAAPR